MAHLLKGLPDKPPLQDASELIESASVNIGLKMDRQPFLSSSMEMLSACGGFEGKHWHSLLYSGFLRCVHASTCYVCQLRELASVDIALEMTGQPFLSISMEMLSACGRFAGKHKHIVLCCICVRTSSYCAHEPMESSFINIGLKMDGQMSSAAAWKYHLLMVDLTVSMLQTRLGVYAGSCCQ